MSTIIGPQLVPVAPGRMAGIGHLLPLARDPMRFFQSIRASGDLVRIYIGPTPMYVVNSPEMLNKLLVTEIRKFHKGKLFDRAVHVVGKGLLTSDGHFHIRQRRMIQPAFRSEHIATWVNDVNRAANTRIQSWKPGQRIDVLAEMHELALDIAINTLLSSDLSDKARKNVHHATPIIVKGFITQLLYPSWVPPWAPIPGNRKFHRAAAELRAVFDEVIVKYRSSEENTGDIFSMLCTADDTDTGFRMTDEQVQDEAVSILLAATETSATVMAWLCYELCHDPGLQQQLRDEIYTTVGNRPVQFDDLRNLTLLDQVVSETLRLHTPNWLLMRRAVEDVQFGQHLIPKGAELIFSPATLHRDPNLYPNPLVFDPSRWNGVQPASLKDAFMPFGSGRRKCIGDRFARVEIMASFATFLQQRSLALPHRKPIHETKLMTTVQPKRLRMIIHDLEKC